MAAEPTMASRAVSEAKTTRIPLTFGDMLLGAVSAPEKRTFKYEIAKPPLGVLPPGVTAEKMAQDSGVASMFGFLNQGMMTEGIMFMGYPYLAELSQRPEYRHVSETIAQEMTRKWIKIKSKGDEDKTEVVEKVNKGFEAYKVQDVFRKAAETDGFMGRSHVYLDFGDTKNPDELETQLIYDSAKINIKKPLIRLTNVEPSWTYPSVYNAVSPLEPDYYKPKAWYVMGKTVHRTRLLTFVGREVPDLLKAAYSFGGMSLSQMVKPYVDHWLRTRNSVSDLIQCFSTMVLKTDMGGALQEGVGMSLLSRVKAFVLFRTNRGVMLIDKEREDLTNVSAQLAGLDKLMAQSQEQIASAAKIPLVKFLGISPTGLNASSDGEIRAFYDTIHAYQRHLFETNLDVIFKVIQLSVLGYIDEDLVYEWEPLWQLDGAELANVRKVNADVDIAYVTASIIAPEEVRNRLSTEDGGAYNGLDPDDLPEPPVDPAAPEGSDDPAGGKAPLGTSKEELSEDTHLETT